MQGSDATEAKFVTPLGKHGVKQDERIVADNLRPKAHARPWAGSWYIRDNVGYGGSLEVHNDPCRQASRPLVHDWHGPEEDGLVGSFSRWAVEKPLRAKCPVGWRTGFTLDYSTNLSGLYGTEASSGMIRSNVDRVADP